MITYILTAAAIALMLLTMRGLFSRNQFEVKGLTVLVTGGSQGLGLSIAKQLASKGANVVIIAQNKTKLETALEEIKGHASDTAQRFLSLSYDLRAPESGPDIIAKVTKWNDGPPDTVFNCAGNCMPGFFASSSLETHRIQMETIYWTCAYLAHATLKEWTKPAVSRSSKPTRHLVFTSSVVAFFPLAGYAPYSPAKAAMRALADTLNQEVAVYNGARLHSQGGPEADIRIHIAYPMGIQSPGYENEQKTKPKLTQLLEEDDKPQHPDELARSLIADLEAGQFALTSTLIGRLMKGWAMGASQRTGILEYLWSFLGSIVVLFIVPDYLQKCKRWGKERGMEAAK